MSFVARDVIDEMIETIIAPELKARGYRKSGNTWNKSSHEAIKVFNVQLSQSNAAHESQFTINLGIYHDQLHRERGTPMPGKFIKEYDCDVRLRIGRLMGGADHWWIVAHNKDNQKVAEGLKYNVLQHAIPWIEGFNGLPDMFKFFCDSGEAFNAAIAARLLGRGDVSELVSRALATANVGFANRVKQWAKHQGISV